jgi:hypothetical protein
MDGLTPFPMLLTKSVGDFEGVKARSPNVGLKKILWQPVQ